MDEETEAYLLTATRASAAQQERDRNTSTGGLYRLTREKIRRRRRLNSDLLTVLPGARKIIQRAKSSIVPPHVLGPTSIADVGYKTTSRLRIAGLPWVPTPGTSFSRAVLVKASILHNYFPGGYRHRKRRSSPDFSHRDPGVKKSPVLTKLLRFGAGFSDDGLSAISYGHPGKLADFL